MPLASRNVVPVDLFPEVIIFQVNRWFGRAKRGLQVSFIKCSKTTHTFRVRPAVTAFAYFGGFANSNFWPIRSFSENFALMFVENFSHIAFIRLSYQPWFATHCLVLLAMN